MNILSTVIVCVSAVLTVLIFRACDNTVKDTQYVEHIQSGGLPFRVTKGPVFGTGFFMRDDTGKRTAALYAASTPFQADKRGEEKIFDMEVNKGGRENGDPFTFYFLLEFDEIYADEVKKLVGRSAWKKDICVVESGEPLAFYIRISKHEEKTPVAEKTVSHVCNSMMTRNQAYKRILRTHLKPGRYTIQIRNERPTQAFQKFASKFLVMED